MEISLSEYFSCLSLIISALALWISYKTYKRDTPTIEIDISNPKYDCFFGNVVTEGMTERTRKNGSRVAGVYLIVRNNSSADIQITNIQLKVKGELFNPIVRGNKFWNEVAFFSLDKEKNEITPDWAYSIDYNENAIPIPGVICSYTVIEGYCIFGQFPAKIKKKSHGTLILTTAIGKVKKKIRLYEYDDTLGRQDYENVKQYYRSQGDI